MRMFKLLFAMARVAEPWEWMYAAALALLLAGTVFHGTFHLPLLLVSFLIIPLLMLVVGLFFIFDNLRNRVR